MTPSLLGRLQSRFVLVAVFGLGWTILVALLVASVADASLADALRATLLALVLVGVFGVVLWEPLYHLVQQYRWEKDWPTGLGLVTGLNEGALVWFVLVQLVDATFAAFLLHFATTWLWLWFVVHGPLRVVHLRWRFRGGRFV